MQAITKRPKLTLIRGLPGSGKTTYAKANYRCLILENDMFHECGGEYDFCGARQRTAIGWCMDTCRTALKAGMDVTVANTFTKRDYIERYRAIAEDLGANFEVIRCSGGFHNVHDVPKPVLESMERGFEDYPGESFAEGSPSRK